MGTPFKISLLNHEDFNFFSKEELFDYFDAFSGTKGWTRPEEIKEEIAYFKGLIVDSGITNFYFISPASTTKRDYLNSTHEESVFVNDVAFSGNLTDKTTTYGWPGQPTIKSIHTTNTYILNHGYYKPLAQYVSQAQSGDPAYDRSVDYQYDAQGHLTSLVNDQAVAGLSAHVLTTAYSQFNAFGYATHIDVSAPDMPARFSDNVYDATGRFVIKEINALNNFKEYAYEGIYGNQVMEKDVTGLVTKYKYDGLGRLARTILPNGAHNKISYAWENPSGYAYDGGTPYGVYSVKTDVEAAGYAKVYYAGNGEELRSETQDHEGTNCDCRYKIQFCRWHLSCRNSA